MAWGALASTFLVGLVLFPGLIWLWTSEKRIPRTARPGALAVAEVSGIGTAATVVASLLLFAIGSWTEWPFDFRDWVADPAAFRCDLAQNPFNLGAAVLVELAIAASLAGAVAVWIHRRKPVIAPGSTVLHETLGTATGKELSTKFVAVTMRDGRLIEGWVGSYPADATERFLSVTAPIYVTEPGEAERSQATSDEVILNLDSVVDIGIAAQPEQPAERPLEASR